MNKSSRFLKRYYLWLLFIGFAVFATLTRKDAFIFLSESSYAFGKYIVWMLFFCFFTYSVYASTQESFFKSLKEILKKYWGWQIGIDLYIGLILPLVIIYFHGGIFVFLLWLIPVLFYANLATLLYLALNYDSLIHHFIL